MSGVSEQKPGTRWFEGIAIGLIVTVVGGLAVWGIERNLTLESGSGPRAESSTTTTPGQVETGTYKGLAIQDSKHAKAWSVAATFSAGSGVIRYDLSSPAKTCRGTLTHQDANEWRERITMGTCDTGGTWTFTQVTPTTIKGAYHPPNNAYTVTAELEKEAS